MALLGSADCQISRKSFWACKTVGKSPDILWCPMRMYTAWWGSL